MLLSILTCTLPERAHYLKRLSEVITNQIADKPVEFLVDPRPRNVPTGTKRNDLIRQCKGAWVCFIDDDDRIADDYVSSILKALESNPDVVTFEGTYTENGRNKVDWVIKLGERYEARTENGKYMFFRYPNHLSVIRKSIANRVRFPDVWQGEDYQFATKLKDLNLLKTSVHIPKQLYFYDFKTNK
jgi:glycosyltransferase involved in cell wall biosynthesis